MDKGNSTRIAVLWLALAFAPFSVAAQSVTDSWPGLKPDTLETIYVVDDSGVETSGKLLGWTADALLIWRDGAEHRIAGDAVARVQKRDSLRNGVIAGAVVGSVMGLFTAAIADCPSGSESGCLGARSSLAVLAAVTYTGMGVGLDALIRGRTTVYDRQPRRQTSITGSVSRTRASLGVGVRW